MDTTENSKLPSQSQNPSNKNQTLVSLPSNNMHDENGNNRSSSREQNNGGRRRRFLGVRERPSGRWVAEIKDSSQKLRLWLGTFDKPEEAAMAYDIAARLLRGRNAKTNFSYHGRIMNFHEQNFRFFGKNPRVYQLLQHAAVTKIHAESSSSSSSTSMVDEGNNNKNDDQSISFDTLVEETIFCSSDSSYLSHGDGLFSSSPFGSSKVYSSVVVSPSFSASLCQESQEFENQRSEKMLNK